MSVLITDLHLRAILQIAGPSRIAANLADPSLQISVQFPPPRVIDERLDLDLVAAVADHHPEWSVVMAGPVVKIDTRLLPQRPNIHWLGMQPYERLPYLRAPPGARRTTTSDAEGG